MTVDVPVLAAGVGAMLAAAGFASVVVLAGTYAGEGLRWLVAPRHMACMVDDQVACTCGWLPGSDDAWDWVEHAEDTR